MTEARLATKADLAEACASLARAFWDDPVMTHLLPESIRSRSSRMTAVMRMEAAEALRSGSLWTAGDGRACAVWKPPGKWKVGGMAILRQTPRSIQAFRGRVPFVLSVVNQIERIHPKEPHWYLAMLGTEPDAQGKGFGSAAMQPVLDHCDAEGEAAYLESSKEQNIPLYERYGFRVTDEVTLARNGPPIWLMWRDPRG